MKETIEKQVIQYSEKTLPELLTLAMAGDREAAGEIIARQEAQKAEIESLKVKAASKTRAPRAEKTPFDLARDNAYFRCALLVKQFGMEGVTMQTLTVASAFLDQGLAQGNLRQAYNRVQQVIKAQAVTEDIFPAWIVQASTEIPVLDENKKLDDPEESEKIEQIKSTIQKYMDSEEQATEQTPDTDQTPDQTPDQKKGSKKVGKK